MSVSKRSDRPGWWVRRKIAGKWIQRYGGETKRQAVELERYLLAELTPRPVTDLNQFVQDIFWPAQLNRLSAESIIRHRSILNKHIGPYFAGPMNQITPQKIMQYITRRKADTASNDTIRMELGVLRHVLNKAVKLDLLERSPFSKLDTGDIPKPSPARIRYLTPEEWDRLLFQIPERHLTFFLFLVNTGCRRGEALRLEHGDLDLDAGIAIVRRDKRGKPKIVPLVPMLIDLLRQRPRLEGNPRVFWECKRGDSFSHLFIRACKRAGIKNCRLHDLRHSFASQLAMRGIDIRTIQGLLGHNTLTMTGRYSHLSQEHLSQSISALDGVYKGRVN